MNERKKEVVVKLDWPLKWDSDELVTEITLRRPKGRDIKSIGKDLNMADLLAIAAKLSGYTPAFFDELDGADCLKVTEVVGDFLDNGQVTGES